MSLRIRSLAMCLLLSSLAACGDDAPPPPPDVDGGADGAVLDAAIDAPTRDAGAPDLGGCTDDDDDGHGASACGGDDCDDTDPTRYPGNAELCDAAGHDEDCNDATLGPDGDGDGFPSIACCFEQAPGTLLCGTDCDDTRATINDTVVESCNMVDDDCDGSVDEGVCIPCPNGYSGTDGACTDNDECAMGQCGVGMATCLNTLGSYECTCAAGFSAPATAGTCLDLNECTMGLPCGPLATACTNTIGSYACSCAPGYGAPPTGGVCADLDECALHTCGTGMVSCTNTPGSFACTCEAGYTAAVSGAACADINECATSTPCGTSGTSCTNTGGSYECTCASGYGAPASGGTCTDIDECALGIDDCDDDPAATCTNAASIFTCACPPGFAGGAHGASGCLLTDTSLSALVPSAGTLNPAFVSATVLYTLALPSGATRVSLTPTVAFPTHATILVNGALVASGAASTAVALAAGSTPVTIVVTTETGATRTYTVVVSRSNAYIKASNTDAADQFGGSVALSADGSTLAVGAYQEDSNATGIGGSQTDNSTANAGAVYVYTRAGSTWSQQAYLKASNTNAGDWFGRSLALSSDGSTLAVGTPLEDSSATGIDGNSTNNSSADAGAVYIFIRTGTTWSQQAYVKASNTETRDYFGYAVAFSSDGSTLAVGAYGEDSNATGIDGNQANGSASSAGAVYVYTRTGSTWAQQAYLKASNTNTGDWFGRAVGLSSDGSTLVVGADSEDSSATGIDGDPTNNSVANAGAVYVFTRASSAWSQQAYVKASNTDAGDQFGIALALSSDGSTLAVGAYGEASNAVGIGGNQADDSAESAGAVYVYTRAGSTWSQQAYLKASNSNASDYFGWSLALSADGTTLAVGAYGEDSSATGLGGDEANNTAPAAGAVYLYTRAGPTWSQQTYLKASNTNGGDEFGWSFALSADGSTLAVGAYYESSNAIGIDGDQTDNSAYNAGAVYIY